jgi:hypothetical protein
MSPAAAGQQGKDFFFLKEKEAKRTSSVWLGAAATGEAHPPTFGVSGRGLLASPVTAAPSPNGQSFFASFFSKKEVLAAFLR